MKKIMARFVTIILTLSTILGIYCTPTYAASKISSNSAYTTTFTVTTKAKLTEALNTYPATLTFTQTKGTCTFTDKNGKTKTSTSNGYCWYDIDYKVYDSKGKYQFSGHSDFCGAKMTFKLKASPFKTYKYVVTIKPHYGYVYNTNTRKYYLGYKWTKPTTWTAQPTHDIVSLYTNSKTKLK